MPVVPPAEGGPLRRRISDLFFEHPLDARRLVAAGSTIVLVVALGVVAWPRSSDDIPTHLPFVTIPPSTTTTSTEVVVHVAGSVLRPGLYHRPSGDRVADLLDAAGGPLDEADLDRLNLAERLLDGAGSGCRRSRNPWTRCQLRGPATSPWTSTGPRPSSSSP